VFLLNTIEVCWTVEKRSLSALSSVNTVGRCWIAFDLFDSCSSWSSWVTKSWISYTLKYCVHIPNNLRVWSVFQGNQKLTFQKQPFIIIPSAHRIYSPPPPHSTFSQHCHLSPRALAIPRDIAIHLIKLKVWLVEKTLIQFMYSFIYTLIHKRMTTVNLKKH